ncbi:beta/gamma crystallin family protein [Sphingomonas sp. SUN039]|uniref:beta/gamma crystallin family protein n=1 Tax=Sphingomonas sp. SUN039 TaxID=2937787 RepID=UPI0021641E08|nr:beta/gamma crystallin family protein [Sphingomonas sp. SUN039]UVO54234.1 beta/gamma crystallin family protein [Sphingomonas sp. SUN039]
MIRTAIACSAVLAIAASAAAAKREPGNMTDQGVVTLYEGQKFEGETVEIKKDMPSISYDITIGSIGIYPGEKWELCEQTRFRGVCNILSANETKLGKIVIRSARMIKPPVATKPAM